MTKVFDEIDKIKKHPIYIEAIRRFWKWFARIVITIVLITALLFGLYYYDYHIFGEQCIQRCKLEHLADDCNGACY